METNLVTNSLPLHTSPEYFDIHSHLNFEQFDTDRESVIAELEKESVWTTTVGTNYTTSLQAVELAEKHPHLFATVGLHPDDEKVFEIETFEKLLTHSKIVAIGETGLDYFRLPANKAEALSEKKRQKKVFEQHIDLALAHNLPLMIHCREAYPDTLEILASKQREVGERLRGNFHFFTSPVDIARQCLDLGFTVSFTGPITYGSMYNEVVDFVPLERMMTETDSPFAAPVPYRGRRNSPLYVKEVVAQIAIIKKLPIDKVQKTIVNTSIEVFLKNIS